MIAKICDAMHINPLNNEFKSINAQIQVITI